MICFIFSTQTGIAIGIGTITTEIGSEIDTEIVETAEIEIGKEIEIGVDRCTIRRIVPKRRIIVLIVTEVVNVCDYQGVILSQLPQLYQEQYSIGKSTLVLIQRNQTLYSLQSVRCSRHVMGQHAPEKHSLQ